MNTSEGPELGDELQLASSQLRETLEAFVYHETHGREHLPLELSRFMRLRAGLLRRGRAARRSDDRWPTCGRCGKRVWAAHTARS